MAEAPCFATGVTAPSSTAVAAGFMAATVRAFPCTAYSVLGALGKGFATGRALPAVLA